jgi:hypothetical protein
MINLFYANIGIWITPPLSPTKLINDVYRLRKSFDFIDNKKTKSRKRVRFEEEKNLITEIVILPLFEYSTILWWTPDELRIIESPSSNGIHPLMDNNNTNNIHSRKSTNQTQYMRLYNEARTQVYCESRLDPETYRKLVEAKRNGSDDERKNSFDRQRISRHSHIRKTVKSVVDEYTRNRIHNSISTDKYQTKNNIVDKIGINTMKFAKSVTKGDTLWAQQIARIDAEVVSTFYNDDSVETVIRFPNSTLSTVSALLPWYRRCSG